MINDLWYKNAIFYCLSVGTYMDANGDGIGDFNGLLRRLDYLQGLGVTAIWLMPFQPSPGRDDGYDVADYYGVDPRYGTLGDFVEFAHGCRAARHPHHSSISSSTTPPISIRGFRRREATPSSLYRDWYVWADNEAAPTPPRAWCFPACRSRPGRYDEEAKAWYFHRFYDFQPDLNTSNPHVQAEILKIMGFWLQLGVSGFRMDAVPFVISTKKAPRSTTRPVEQYDMLRTLSRIPAMARRRRDHARGSQRAADTMTWNISARPASACR